MVESGEYLGELFEEQVGDVKLEADRDFERGNVLVGIEDVI